MLELYEKNNIFHINSFDQRPNMSVTYSLMCNFVLSWNMKAVISFCRLSILRIMLHNLNNMSTLSLSPEAFDLMFYKLLSVS